MEYMFKLYLQIFTGVVSSCHAVNVSDFFPNPINHVHIYGCNRFCYPCP